MSDLVKRLRTICHSNMEQGAKLTKTALEAAAEIERLRAALNKALALCRYCDGTSTAVRTDAETGEIIGAENCEKCWPLRSVSELGG